MKNELLRQALYALEIDGIQPDLQSKIKAELAKPEHDPVAWTLSGAEGKLDANYCTMYFDEASEWLNTTIPGCSIIPLFTAPQQQKPLSDDEIAELWGENLSGHTLMVKNFARAVERKHGIGVGND